MAHQSLPLSVIQERVAAYLIHAAGATSPLRMLWLHSATVALQPRLSTRQHAIELRDRGYTVIPDAGINPSLIADARAACLAEHQWLLEGVAELGIDAVADKYAFAEIDKRHRLRWALKPSRGPSAWTRAVDEAVQVAADVIEEVHRQPAHPDDSDAVWTRHLPLPTRAEVLDTGAILSAPGAAAQTFHADSGKLHHRLARLSPRHRLYSLFVPLVDLDEGGDGTMLWPGSHLEQTRYDRCAPPRPPSVAHAASLGFPEGTRKAHALGTRPKVHPHTAVVRACLVCAVTPVPAQVRGGGGACWAEPQAGGRRGGHGGDGRACMPGRRPAALGLPHAPPRHAQ